MDQKPSVGRIVHVYTLNTDHHYSGMGAGPYAAIVTQVFSDTCINATVFASFGPQRETASILRKDAAAGSSDWWEWPPRV